MYWIQEIKRTIKSVTTLDPKNWPSAHAHMLSTFSTGGEVLRNVVRNSFWPFCIAQLSYQMPRHFYFEDRISWRRYKTALRHYATSRKVAGSIPYEVIGFFNWPNPPSRTMALGSTQPLTGMSTRNLTGGKERPAREADNLTAFC
jgi:hypothetical protein